MDIHKNQGRQMLQVGKWQHAMKKTKAQHDGAKWRCFRRLVRWGGFEFCWLGMMGMILVANTKSAGFDALLVAIFAWSLGYGTGRFSLKSNAKDYRATPKA